MRFGENEVQPMLNEFGVEAAYSYGGTSYLVKGILDEVDRDELSGSEGEFAGRLFMLTVKTGALPSVAEGSTVTVEAVARTVIQTRRIADGLLTVLYLA